MGLESLLDILKKAQERHPAFKLRLAEAEALGRWNLAVGEQIAKHARAIRVQSGVLWVEVVHPIWKAELHYRKQQILDILNGKTMGASATRLAPPIEILKDIFYTDAKPPTSGSGIRENGPRKPGSYFRKK